MLVRCNISFMTYFYAPISANCVWSVITAHNLTPEKRYSCKYTPDRVVTQCSNSYGCQINPLINSLTPPRAPGAPLSPFSPLSIHFLIFYCFYFFSFPFLIRFTYVLLLSILSLFCQSSPTSFPSRRSYIGGDRTWV